MKWIREVTERFKRNFPCYSRTFYSCVQTIVWWRRDAELQLTEADYLTAGIDIVVQTTGQKVATFIVTKWWWACINCYSLLFAILKVRSAPFVILDEVEAALDEANVIRYVKYLNELSDETQFIVITQP